MAVRRSVRKS